MAKGPIARKRAANPHTPKEYYVQRYADGKPKPMFRGVMHIILACCFLGAGAAVTLGILLSPELMPLGHDRWWPMVGFLAGKGVSYTASAVFHLYPFRRVTAVTWAYKLDLMAVSHLCPGPPLLVETFGFK